MADPHRLFSWQQVSRIGMGRGAGCHGNAPKINNPNSGDVNYRLSQAAQLTPRKNMGKTNKRKNDSIFLP